MDKYHKNWYYHIVNEERHISDIKNKLPFRKRISNKICFLREKVMCQDRRNTHHTLICLEPEEVG